jgi:dihydrofolate reductase
MARTQYYTATSLDGFIATSEHSLDWLFTRQQDDDGPMNYGEFIAEVGAMAMGSTTYEWIIDHEFKGRDQSEWKWPYDIPSWVFTHRDLQLPPGADIRPCMRRWSTPPPGRTCGSSAAVTWQDSSPMPASSTT